MGAPQDDVSVMRNAGRPAMRIDVLPDGNGAGGCGPAKGGMRQMCVSPTMAAGSPAMTTLGAPGPPTMPGWPVWSPTRAAGGMRAASQLIVTSEAFTVQVPADLMFTWPAALMSIPPSLIVSTLAPTWSVMLVGVITMLVVLT